MSNWVTNREECGFLLKGVGGTKVGIYYKRQKKIDRRYRLPW